MNHPTEPAFAAPGDTVNELETPVMLPAAAARATIVTLQRFEEFFRGHASPAVHAELRAYCATLCWHPVCGAQALLDDLGLTALPLSWDLDPPPDQPAARTTPARITHEKEITCPRPPSAKPAATNNSVPTSATSN